MISKKIAYSGILLALNMILFIMLNIFQTNTIFIMVLSSFIVSVIIMEWDVKTGILFYIASILLGFIIISNKIHLIVYALTFGLYGIAKFFIENDRSIVVEYILKLVYANIALAITYFIIDKLIFIPKNIYFVFIFEIAFLVYDYVYSLFIEYYQNKLKKLIR